MYLYLDATRPHSSCRGLFNEGADIFCGRFEEPSEEEVAACPDYDEWKYGVDGFPTSGYMYLEKMAGSSEVDVLADIACTRDSESCCCVLWVCVQAVSERTSQLRQKDIHFVLGK